MRKKKEVVLHEGGKKSLRGKSLGKSPSPSSSGQRRTILKKGNEQRDLSPLKEKKRHTPPLTRGSQTKRGKRHSLKNSQEGKRLSREVPPGRGKRAVCSSVVMKKTFPGPGARRGGRGPSLPPGKKKKEASLPRSRRRRGGISTTTTYYY